jgi:hypothetical protein
MHRPAPQYAAKLASDLAVAQQATKAALRTTEPTGNLAALTPLYTCPRVFPSLLSDCHEKAAIRDAPTTTMPIRHAEQNARHNDPADAGRDFMLVEGAAPFSTSGRPPVGWRRRQHE